MHTRIYHISKHDISLFSARGELGRGLAVVLFSLGFLASSELASSQMASSEPVGAQAVIDSRREYNVKAVTLYAIGRYVRWPESVFPSKQSPFVIGVLGANPFGETLQRIAKKKTIHGRPILIHEYATVEDCTTPCHILFVTRSIPPDKEARLIERLQGDPVLLVGESTGFASRGGAINFYVVGNHVRFELNPEQALQSNLVLNAKMHSLGTRVSSQK